MLLPCDGAPDPRGGFSFGGTLECRVGDVDAGDVPPAEGQPDRVVALTAAEVQRGAGSEVFGFLHHQRVGIAAPLRRAAAVEVLPELRRRRLRPVVLIV